MVVTPPIWEDVGDEASPSPSGGGGGGQAAQVGIAQRVPPPSGDPILDVQEFIIRVNGIKVTPGRKGKSWHRAHLRTIAVGSNTPRELVIAYVGPVARQDGAGEEPPVRLYDSITVDTVKPRTGRKDIRIFNGKVYRAQPAEQPDDPTTEYVCLGPLQVAHETQFLNTIGGPLVQMFVAVVPFPFNHQFGGVTNVFIALEQVRLLALVNDAQFPWSSSTYLNRPQDIPVPDMDFTNVTIKDAVDQILRFAPGFKYVVDPDTNVWTFYDEFKADELTIVAPTDAVAGHNISIDAVERYTAVQLQGNIEISGVEATLREVTLLKTWQLSDEGVWWISFHGGLQKENDSWPKWAIKLLPSIKDWGESLIAERLPWVFRRWTFNAPTDPINTDLPVKVMRRVAGQGTNPIDKWVQVKIEGDVDFGGRIVFTSGPQIKGKVPGNWRSIRNSTIPGKSLAPATGDLVLLYHTTQVFGVIRRWPTGNTFSGTAFDQLGLERTLYRFIPDATGANIGNARRLHAAVSNIRFSGTIKIAGPIDSNLWGLRRRINIKTDGKVSDMDTMRAPLKSVSYDFEKRQASYSVHSDRVGDLVVV